MKQLVALLVLVSLMVGFAPTVAADENPTCTESTLSFEVTLEWALDVLHLSKDTVVVKFGSRVIGTVIILDVEYYSDEGELVLVQKTVTLSDTCTPQFEESVPADYDCTVSVSAEELSKVLAEGDLFLVFYEFEEWKVKLGPITTTYTEEDLYLVWLEYKVTFEGIITKMTTTCTPPYTPGWQPGPAEIIAWQLKKVDGGENPMAAQWATYYWVDPLGNRTETRLGGDHRFDALSLVLPAGDYPANPGYGVWNTDDPENPTITPWGRFQVEVDGVVIQDVLVASCFGPCVARSYWIGGDTTNLEPRPYAVWYKAWQ